MSQCTTLLCRRWEIGLRPLCGANLSVKKGVYDYRLCRAKVMWNVLFGILSNKLKIFQRPLNVSPNVILLRPVFLCTIFFAREMVISLRTLWEWLVLKMYLMDKQYLGVNSIKNNVRSKVANYILTDAGDLPWQMSKFEQWIKKMNEDNLTLLVPMCSIIIIKYMYSSNTSTTFYKVSTGYTFRPSSAIIRPYIWTGSFEFSAFWDPKLLQGCY